MNVVYMRSMKGIKIWRKRYCTISPNGVLFCYDDEKMSKLFLEIDINGNVLEVAEVDRRRWYYFTIDLIQPVGRLRKRRMKLYFRVSTFEARARWIEQIQMAP